ncbi:MAG TPA: response regulator [Alphaproteobacteria bacterium]|nr:response regulator [Alphaproteobacteria bacterium]
MTAINLSPAETPNSLAKILIVDDEQQIRRFLRISLNAYGYEVLEAAAGEEAVTRTAIEGVDLVILDLGLPDIDGHAVIERVREWSQVPIIVLSVRSGDVEKVRALDGGAEDYLTKPFSIAELMARVRAALRKRGDTVNREPVFSHGTLTVDLGKRRVTVSGAEVRLSRKEYGILKMLAANPGRVLTHQQLLRELWGPAHVEDTHYLRIHVGHLRQKLGDNPAQPRYILTEPGIGYRLAEES